MWGEASRLSLLLPPASSSAPPLLRDPGSQPGWGAWGCGQSQPGVSSSSVDVWLLQPSGSSSVQGSRRADHTGEREPLPQCEDAHLHPHPVRAGAG